MAIANPTTMTPAAPAWPVLGQGPVVALLQGAIARGGVAHAYLFAGPPRSGRGTLARLFAQTLNCEAGAPALAPCGACRSCRKIARGVHPDVQVVGLASQAAGGSSRRESKNTSLGIDTIRELQQGLNLRPLEGRWKVAIVEDAETMQEAAANAFLKTLEEPPPFAVLVLLVTEGAAVLPTIRSRCQVVEVRPVERAELAGALVAERGVAPDDARTLAALARGRAGWALDAAARPDFLAERRATLDAMLATLEGPPAGLGPLVDRLTDRCRKGRRDEVYAELDAWLGLWRDLLLARSACAELVLNADYTERLRALARRYELAQLREAVAATGDVLRQLDENAAPRLVLETLALRWADASREPGVGSRE